MNTPNAAPAATYAPPPAAERRISGNPLWAIPLRQLNATRDRPLFAPSRRPRAPVVASAPPPRPAEKPPESEPLQLSLVGTVAGENGAFGVFLDKAAGTPLRLKVGEKHKGWTLRSVGRRDVLLAKGMTTTLLPMVTSEPAKPKGPGPANAVAPSAVAPKAQSTAPSQPPTAARMEVRSTTGTPPPTLFDLGIFKPPSNTH